MLAPMEDLRYISAPTRLAEIAAATTEIQFSMSSEPLVGALLRTLAATKPGGHFLELGTGTGIATAWLLAGMDETSTLVSVDNDKAVQDVALKAFEDDPRLTLVTSGVLEYLATQCPFCFDLVFADAMSGKYEGLDAALNVVKPGGFYIVDDMLPQANWPPGHAERIPKLIDQLASRVDFEVLPLIWASGVVIAIRKSIS
jgi:predicted O-methyltransferase YrrM